MKKIILLLCAIFSAFSVNAFAQPRPVEKTQPGTQPAVKRTAPESFQAKYQGGMFGYSKKEEGTLKFDDINERLIFLGKDGKEKFSISYKALLVVYPSSHKVQSGTGRAVSHIPIPGAGIGGLFMKKRKNYLMLQFRDPDVDVQGTTTFLVDTSELLESVIHTLGEKAEMLRRGDAYYRPSEPRKVEL
jgi:hypothetical protein